MPLVLVVDDNPVDRTLAGRILTKEPGLAVSYAVDGADALQQIRQQLPDAVVTDLQMPEMDGLQLVASIKQSFPLLPVILMTAQGSEEIATEALRIGAASYVPKSSLAKHLGEVVSRIVSAAAIDRSQSRLMNALTECHCRFTLQNDPGLIDPLVNRLQEMLRCLPLADESERLRVAIAVKHAILSGLYLGNLELPPATEDFTSPEAIGLILDRSADPYYVQRKLVIDARLSPERAEFRIQHEGPGFDRPPLPQAQDVARSSSHLIRGWILTRSIMDETELSPDGRTLTLIKRAVSDPEFLLED